MSSQTPDSHSNTLKNLAADGLLVLLAAFVSTLVRLDAQSGTAPGAWGLAGGAGGFLLILEQLHQQVELETAARLQLLDVDGDVVMIRTNLRFDVISMSTFLAAFT